MKKIEKIFQFIKNQLITITAFEQKAGLSNGYLRNIEKSNSEISGKMLSKMYKAFPELESYLENESLDSVGNNIRRVPVLDAEAAAGLDNEINMTPQLHPSGYVDVGDLLRDSESAMYVYGNSMTPNYPSGCLVGLKRNYDGYIQPGETYVVETRSNRVIKRLYWNEDKTAYECHSDNTMMYEAGPRKGKYFYEPFEIPLGEVIRLFDVIGIIKRNRNSLIP